MQSQITNNLLSYIDNIMDGADIKEHLLNIASNNPRVIEYEKRINDLFQKKDKEGALKLQEELRQYVCNEMNDIDKILEANNINIQDRRLLIKFLEKIKEYNPEIGIDINYNNNGSFKVVLGGDKRDRLQEAKQYNNPIYERLIIPKPEVNVIEEEEEVWWDKILAGLIILLSILAVVFAFVKLNQQKNELLEKKKQEEAQKQQREKPKENIKPNEEDLDASAKEKVCVATTQQDKVLKDKNGNEVVTGNCDPTKTDVKGVELTEDAKQALNTVSNPHNKYEITYDNSGKKVDAFGLVGGKDGKISWVDAKGTTHTANKNDITITDVKNNLVLSDKAENIMCNLTPEVRKTNDGHLTTTVDWYYDSDTKISHNPSSGNFLDITYQDGNSTWGRVAVTNTNTPIGDVAYKSITNAITQNPNNALLNGLKLNNETKQISIKDITNNFNYTNENKETIIGSYNDENGFSSDIGNNSDDLKNVVNTENKVINEKGVKLVAVDKDEYIGSKTKDNDKIVELKNLKSDLPHQDVIKYEVRDGKLTVTLNELDDNDNFITKTFNSYDNLKLQSSNGNDYVTRDQLKLANNIDKYIDPNTKETYVTAKNLTTKATVNTDNTYNFTFDIDNKNLGRLNGLSIEDVKSNQATVQTYNNNSSIRAYQMLKDWEQNHTLKNNQIPQYNTNVLTQQNYYYK